MSQNTSSAVMPRKVILESPYAGDVETNLRNARAAMRDCLLRGEAPYASHLLYTQPGVLDDGDHGDDELHDVEDHREEDHVDHPHPGVSVGQVVFGFLLHGWGSPLRSAPTGRTGRATIARNRVRSQSKRACPVSMRARRTPFSAGSLRGWWNTPPAHSGRFPGPAGFPPCIRPRATTASFCAPRRRRSGGPGSS